MKAHQFFLLIGLAFGLSACATKTTEGPVAAGPVAVTQRPPQVHQSPAPVVTATPRPRPTPTPDPFAPSPIPQKPQMPGVSPLSHGPDQPLYQRQQ